MVIKTRGVITANTNYGKMKLGPVMLKHVQQHAIRNFSQEQTQSCAVILWVTPTPLSYPCKVIAGSDVRS